MTICAGHGTVEERGVTGYFVIVPEVRSSRMVFGAPLRDAGGMIVLASREDAEDYLQLSGLSDGWRVRESSRGEVISLDIAFGYETPFGSSSHNFRTF